MDKQTARTKRDERAANPREPFSEAAFDREIERVIALDVPRDYIMIKPDDDEAKAFAEGNDFTVTEEYAPDRIVEEGSGDEAGIPRMLAAGYVQGRLGTHQVDQRDGSTNDVQGWKFRMLSGYKVSF